MFLKGRFGLLLSSMVLMFLVAPLIPGERRFIGMLMDVLGLVVLLSCLRVISGNRRFFVGVALLCVINVVLGSVGIISTSDPLGFQVAVLLFRLAVYLIIFSSIMGYVLDPSPVTNEKIYGALSGYLILGIIWALVYALFFTLEPGSFSLPEELQGEGLVGMWAYYFSFTTLTTLGYGDITPRLPAVQSYAMVEAACGQIFLAVLIARLVALQIIHSNGRQDVDGGKVG